MDKLPIIDLTERDIINLRYRVIGSGTDANVYKAPNGLAFKIYHANREIKSGEYENTIKTLIDRQKEVKLTKLPLGILRKEGTTVGCFMERHRKYFDVNKFAKLSKKHQIMVLHSLLDKVNELVENDIYHLDINYQGRANQTSNIMINRAGQVELVDFDGGSAVVLDQKNAGLANFVFTSTGHAVAERIYEKYRQEQMLDDKDYKAVSNALYQSLHQKDLGTMHEAIDRAYKKK